jgi:predicted aconitase with swiveling domain
MSALLFKGRGLVGGLGEGEALVTKSFFGFTHGVDPQTGKISDERHEWRGLNMKGKVLIFPFGKSSSSGAIWILETVRCGNAPAAIINVEAEPIIGVGCLLAGMLYGKAIVLIDRLDQNPCDIIKNGDHVRFNGDLGLVEILERAVG